MVRLKGRTLGRSVGGAAPDLVGNFHVGARGIVIRVPCQGLGPPALR
jgi:hypothetical protein